MMKGRSHGNYTNPCLTMHQPWASLLVYGIKRIEGRSWPAPIRGRLWIHAASKIPDESTIKAMEEFYREIYAVDGVTDIKFPEHYPISRLIGCVEVVGCLKQEELAAWDKIPEGVRLEAQTDVCWLCEQPQKLLVPFEMRGYQKVYNLEKKIFDAAVRGVTVVKSPFPVKFPLPIANDPFSLKPGSLALNHSEAVELDKSSTLSAAIAGARAAATQFSKKDQNTAINQSLSYEEVGTASQMLDNVSISESSASNGKEQTQAVGTSQISSDIQPVRTEQRRRLAVDSKIFAAAMKGLKPS